MHTKAVPRALPGPLAFIALTFALSWSIWIATWLLTGRPASIGTSSGMMIAIYAGSFAPGVTAAILYGLSGRKAVLGWLRTFIQFRCGWRAYAAALVPIPVTLLLLTVVLGYTPRLDRAHGLPAVAFYLTLFPVSLFNGLATVAMGAGPLGEEGGWRGFLLPRLLERCGEVRASVLVGVAWALWHLPIMAMFADWRGGVGLALYLPLYVAGVIALSLVMTRVWRIGGGSLVPCIWLHGVINALGGVAFDRRVWSSGWSPAASNVHFDAAIWLAAGLLLLIAGKKCLPALGDQAPQVLTKSGWKMRFRSRWSSSVASGGSRLDSTTSDH
jgi:membrane protease YdiL (CAAX protease family)